MGVCAIVNAVCESGLIVVRSCFILVNFLFISYRLSVFLSLDYIWTSQMSVHLDDNIRLYDEVIS